MKLALGLVVVAASLVGCGSISDDRGRADGGPDLGDGGGDAQVADAGPPPVTVRRPLVQGGPWSAIVIGDSGLPVVFFLADDPEVSDLRVLDCETPTCQDAELSSRAFEIPGGNSNFRAVIDPDGRPVLAYRQDGFNGGEGKLIRCTDSRCRTTPPEVQKPLELSSDGEWASIALQQNGFPMVAWRDSAANTTDAFLCDDAVCTSPTAIPFGAADAGQGAGIALAPSGFAVLAAQSLDSDTDDGDIRVSMCTNDSCSSRVDRDLASADTEGFDLALVVPEDGRPLLFHRDATNGDLIATKCGGTNCSSNDSVTIDGEGAAPEDPTGFHNTAAIAPDGLALVAYHDPVAGVLKIAKCNDDACSDPVVRVVDDGVRESEQHVVGLRPHIAFAADGNPVLSYADATGAEINLAFCGAPDCESVE